jgi:chromosome segregation ATPase
MSFLNSKKLKELQSENEELKKLLEGISEKENQLKHFDELVKKSRLQYAEIAAKKDQTAQKLETLERDKTKLLNELSKLSLEIKQLREIKLAENNHIISLKNALIAPDQNSENENDSFSKSKQILSNELEAAEKRKNDIALDTFNLRRKYEVVGSKISDSKIVLDRLNADIEKKKEEISSLMDRQRILSQSEKKNFHPEIENRNTGEIESRISALINHENDLLENIDNRKRQLEDLERKIAEKELFAGRQTSASNEQISFSQTESAKRELIPELDIKIQAMEAQLASLNYEIKTKTELHNELQSENKQILKNIKSGREEFTRLNESIEIGTIRLTDLDYSLNILDNEFDKLRDDISEKMTLKEKIESQIIKRSEEKVNLEVILRELKETTTILAQLKSDIEKGTGQSAKRFTGVLQYYSTMINDIYKKKLNVEKSLVQKEKELEVKQNLIDERQATLMEMENILYVRYDRTGIIKDLTRAIVEQRKQLEKNGFASEDQDQTNKLALDMEISHQKLIDYENALKEILNSSDKYASDLINKRSSLEKEILANKNRLNELNQNVRHSTSELSELKNSISKIKIEHEDHRVSINKFAAIKTKLEDQINSYKLVIDKYTKIKEKIREEQDLIKTKRDLASRINSSNKISVGQKTLESHNTKWIKL